jgi:hypothetical protein
VLLGGAYVLGPGFAIGTGTVVSPSAVQLGPVPAFPLLAALPDDGATPWFTTALMGLPVLVAAVSVALVQRRHPVRAWDLAALRGLGSGVMAGVLTGILTSFAGGALGDGRMAGLGASTGEVLVASMLAMGTGGLIGALVMTYLQHRGPADEGDDTEATVEVPLARTSAPRPLPRVHEVREVPDDQEDTVEVRLDGD